VWLARSVNKANYSYKFLFQISIKYVVSFNFKIFQILSKISRKTFRLICALDWRNLNASIIPNANDWQGSRLRYPATQETWLMQHTTSFTCPSVDQANHWTIEDKLVVKLLYLRIYILAWYHTVRWTITLMALQFNTLSVCKQVNDDNIYWKDISRPSDTGTSESH
jgi:hypothetical protein